jgi:hypothetical protein
MAKAKKPVNDFPPNLKLLGTHDICNCGTEQKPIFQFVYGTELYGTLFGVFARFKVEKDGKIKSVKLQLFNYRGMINVGFTTDALTYRPSDKSITFIVQGTARSRTHKITFNPPIPMTPGKRFPITFRRILRPLPGFVKAIATYGSKPKTPIPPTAITSYDLFDSEFCYRSGQDCFAQPLRAGMEGAKIGGTRFPSAHCFESQVNLLI